MLSFTPMLKLEQVKEGGAAGGTPAKVEPNPPATPSPSDAPKGQEDLDDLGYEKVAEVKTAALSAAVKVTLSPTLSLK